MEFTLVPKITEKTLAMVDAQNVYTFVVYGNVNKVSKSQVQEYVKQNFNVNVEAVNSQIRLGKEKRFGKNRTPYRTKSYKMVLVKVKKGDSIPGFNLSEDSNS